MSLLLTVGKKWWRVFDLRIRRVRPRYIQLDEVWSFIHAKENHLGEDDPTESGDTYAWAGLGSQTMPVISYLVGKRDAERANTFVRDVSNRVLGRCQVKCDGFKCYIEGVEEAWGADVDFAQLIKLYGKPDNAGTDCYGPAKIIETVPTSITGNPDPKPISTRSHCKTGVWPFRFNGLQWPKGGFATGSSHIDRSSLTVRIHLPQVTRLTNGFSKKSSRLRAGVSIYMTWYNFCGVHQTLHVTPTMEASISNHIGDLKELLES